MASATKMHHRTIMFHRLATPPTPPPPRSRCPPIHIHTPPPTRLLPYLSNPLQSILSDLLRRRRSVIIDSKPTRTAAARSVRERRTISSCRRGCESRKRHLSHRRHHSRTMGCTTKVSVCLVWEENAIICKRSRLIKFIACKYRYSRG